MAGSTLFMQQQKLGLLLRLGVVAVVLVIGGWLVHSRIETEVMRLVENGLNSQRDTFVDGVGSWMESNRQFAEVLTTRQSLREWTRASLAGDEEASAWIDAGLMEAGEHAGLSDYLILDADEIIRQRHHGAAAGKLPASMGDYLRTAATGKAVITPPLMLPAGEQGQPTPMIAAVAPFMSARKKPFAYLVMLYAAEEEFARFMLTGQLGESGEVYAVDKAGRLLTPSRFPDQLREVGLLAPDATGTVLQIEVRDPQRNLLEAGGEVSVASLPFTKAVAALVEEGGQGGSLRPYRDYRGVPVVGAWEWMPEIGIGIICELDGAEAYRPLGVLRTIFGVLIVLLAAATVVGLIISQRGAALRRRAKQAEAKLEQLGQYHLEKKIGEGGMGAVYLGHHAMMRRKTAIKLIHDQSEAADLKLFEREVRLCCQLTHPNTIAIYDYGRNEAGTFYYAMEFLSGADLERIVEKDGPMPPGRVIKILAQACGSLAEAHRLNLIHRDIKPANIYLTERGGIYDFVKVLDFGLAKSLDKNAAQLSAVDVISGTPPYMCPEVIQQQDDIDGRSDIYSLAIVGYYMLSGKLPFDHEGVMDTLMSHINDAPPALSELADQPIPPDLETVLMTCLNKDPDQRPADADALRRALLDCADAEAWTEDMAVVWWRDSWGDDPGTAQHAAMSSAIKPTMAISSSRMHEGD